MEFSCQPELKVKTKQDFSMAQWFALDALGSGEDTTSHSSQLLRTVKGFQ